MEKEQLKKAYIGVLIRSVGIQEGTWLGVNVAALEIPTQVDELIAPWISGAVDLLESPISNIGGAEIFTIPPLPLPQILEDELGQPWGYPSEVGEFPRKEEMQTRFKDALGQLGDSETDMEKVLPLAYSCFGAVPIGDQGVNLYDYAKIRAAISQCWWRSGSLDLVVIKGEVGGIQTFIFDVPSAGAAKNLKARSFRVQAMTKLVCKQLLVDLDLEEGHVLYDGGGNVYLFAPRTVMGRLEAIRSQIQGALLNDSLTFDLAWQEATAADLLASMGMGRVWDQLGKHLNENKLRPYQSAKVDNLFAVMAPRNEMDRREAEKEVYSKFARRLMQSQGFSIRNSGTPGPYALLGWEFAPDSSAEKCEVLFNRIDLGNQGALPVGFTQAVYQMPVWRDGLTSRIQSQAKGSNSYGGSEGMPSPEVGDLIEFEALSEFASLRTGTQRLGIFKADIDNLGKVFSGAMKPGRMSVFHVGALSRMLKWFFEGRMNALLDTPVKAKQLFPNLANRVEAMLEDETYRDNVYTLFSGGDDFFIVGAWDVVVEYALYVQEEFRKFTQGAMTISAGLVLVDEKTPVVRFAELVDEAEALAKQGKKNAIALFGEVLSWEDFQKAVLMTRKLLALRVAGEPSAILWKVRRVVEPLPELYRRLRQGGKIAAPRIWRLHQGLRTVKKHNIHLRDDILDEVIQNLKLVLQEPQAAPNPAYIMVATRWAELLTKNLDKKNGK